MRRGRGARWLALGIVLGAAWIPATAAAPAPTAADTAPQVEHLRAFARLYGYVRYFHPSDEASAIDWNRFAVHGSERVLAVDERAELATVLRELFAPIAPSVQVLAPEDDESPPWRPEDAEGLFVTAWQHLGDGLTSGYAGVYQSVRLHRPRTLPVRQRGGPPEEVTVTPPLFPEHPEIGEAVRAPLGAGLTAVVPLALYADAERTYPRPAASGEPLHGALAALDPASLTAGEARVRVAGVVVAWNVFQHFYPYFDVVEVDWDAVLTGSLERAIAGMDADSHVENLELLTAALADGHAGVHAGGRFGKLPVRLGWIEERLVVLASADPRIGRGDLLRAVDGVDAAEVYAGRVRRLSGSPQWRRHRALSQGHFARGEIGSRAVLSIESQDGERFEVEVERVAELPEPPHSLPPLHEHDDGVWYVDLSRVSLAELRPVLPRLASAPGVVFDMRRYPADGAKAIVRHLLTAPDTSGRWMRTPRIVVPDRRRLVGWLEEGWQLEPAAPHLDGAVAFLTGPGAISYAESVLGLVDHYRLGEIVGEATAGTNGNINFIHLPGRLAIVWTGMKVVRHDGSRHHLVGIRPTVPASATVAGLRAGRDEPLAVALATVRAEIGRAASTREGAR